MEDMILFYDLVLRKFFSFKSVVFYFLVKLFFIYLKIYLVGKAIYYCFFFSNTRGRWGKKLYGKAIYLMGSNDLW